MTHYYVHYSGNDTEEDRAKARQDAREWLDAGKMGFDGIEKLFKKEEPGITFDRFCLLMSFGGIQGYPVGVLYRDWFGREPDWNREEA